MLKAHLLPQNDMFIKGAEQRSSEKEKRQEEYNAGGRSLTKMSVGDIVTVQDPKTKTWNKIAEIVEKRRSEHSFVIQEVPTGKRSVRSRTHLRPCPQSLVPRCMKDKQSSDPEDAPPSKKVREEIAPEKKPRDNHLADWEDKGRKMRNGQKSLPQEVIASEEKGQMQTPLPSDLQAPANDATQRKWQEKQRLRAQERKAGKRRDIDKEENQLLRKLQAQAEEAEKIALGKGNVHSHAPREAEKQMLKRQGTFDTQLMSQLDAKKNKATVISPASFHPMNTRARKRELIISDPFTDDRLKPPHKVHIKEVEHKKALHLRQSISVQSKKPMGKEESTALRAQAIPSNDQCGSLSPPRLPRHTALQLYAHALRLHAVSSKSTSPRHLAPDTWYPTEVPQTPTKRKSPKTATTSAQTQTFKQKRYLTRTSFPNPVHISLPNSRKA